MLTHWIPTYLYRACLLRGQTILRGTQPFVNEPSGFYTKAKRNVAKRNVNDILSMDGWLHV